MLAFSFNFPKLAEVVSFGNVLISCVATSCTVKSTFFKLPFGIILFISLNELTLPNFLHKFSRVPPPTPVPPICSQCFCVAFTKAVPVPILITKPFC